MYVKGVVDRRNKKYWNNNNFTLLLESDVWRCIKYAPKTAARIGRSRGNAFFNFTNVKMITRWVDQAVARYPNCWPKLIIWIIFKAHQKISHLFTFRLLYCMQDTAFYDAQRNDYLLEKTEIELIEPGRVSVACWNLWTWPPACFGRCFILKQQRKNKMISEGIRFNAITETSII